MPHREWRGAGLVDRIIVQKSLKVGAAGADIAALLRLTPSLSPAQVAANTTAEQAFTVAGLKVGDVVISVNKPTAQAGLGIVGWRVSDDDELSIVFSNNTASPITPTAAEAYAVLLWRP